MRDQFADEGNEVAHRKPEGPMGRLEGEASDPNPEVLERPVRRRFTAAYKADILRQVDACAEPGAVGALLRREGLYSSHLANWRKQLR